MNVIIIGTGNIAQVIGKRLSDAGHRIVQVYGRNAVAAKSLSGELSASFCDEWKNIERGADIYLLAISDSALYELDQHLQLEDELVLHLAGSVRMDVLKNVSDNYGVCWPIQSISSNKETVAGIPFMIDANNEKNRGKIKELLNSISNNISIGDDDQRLKMHLAAIMCNNFVNHLYSLTELYCKENKLEFSQLLPIIHETASRIDNYSPSMLQTGPAIRRDAPTIQNHLDLLSSQPDLQKLYVCITDSIQEFYKK